MASNLTFTGSAFANIVNVNVATANQVILAADPTYDRRIYGISQTIVSGATTTATIFLNNGTTSFSIGLGPASGATANTTTDIFGNSTLAAVFQKQRDANGSPYFNLPVGWSINVTLSATPGSINFTIIGEKYN